MTDVTPWTEQELELIGNNVRNEYFGANTTVHVKWLATLAAVRRELEEVHRSNQEWFAEAKKAHAEAAALTQACAKQAGIYHAQLQEQIRKSVALDQDVREAKAQVAQLREALKDGLECTCPDPCLMDALAAHESQYNNILVKKIDQMRPYLNHRRDCAHWQHETEEFCTCGLNEARAALAGAPPTPAQKAP